MRRIHLVIVLLITLLAGTRTSNLPKTNCLDKNPFLLLLNNSTDNNVTIFNITQATKKTSHKCSYEWNTYGSCCEYKSLLKFAEADKVFIHESMSKLKQGIMNIMGNLTDLIPKLNITIQKNNTSLEVLRDAIETFKSAHPHMQTEYLEATVHFLRAKNISTCADELSRVRGSALCDICSGNSHNYMLKDKALVSTQVCEQLYSKCEDQIAVASIFIWSLAKDLKDLKQVTEPQNTISKSIIMPTPLEQELAKEKEMMYLILNKKNQTQADKVAFCERMIKLVQLPLFFKFIADQSEILSLINSISGDLTRIESEGYSKTSQTTTSNYETSRLLQSDLSTNITSELTGDLIVAPLDPRATIDSSYTSFFGATGTSMNEASHTGLRPMNLTHEFP